MLARAQFCTFTGFRSERAHTLHATLFTMSDPTSTSDERKDKDTGAGSEARPGSETVHPSTPAGITTAWLNDVAGKVHHSEVVSFKLSPVDAPGFVADACRVAVTLRALGADEGDGTTSTLHLIAKVR